VGFEHELAFPRTESGQSGKNQKDFLAVEHCRFRADDAKREYASIYHRRTIDVYGISKQAGERWCEYYHNIFGVDVRSIRYPGLISWTTPPGGGTTDYAVDIYHKAIEDKTYECFLSAQTALPMMYMDDAIRATIEIMQAPAESIKIRSSYNLSAISFTPEEIAEEIKKHIPEFTITYNPDFRQKIADSWPSSIDDSFARRDWGWNHKFDLDKMTVEMLKNLQSVKA
jgi:nucleoside-diphosphate-sugar epimerase